MKRLLGLTTLIGWITMSTAATPILGTFLEQPNGDWTYRLPSWTLTMSHGKSLAGVSVGDQQFLREEAPVRFIVGGEAIAHFPDVTFLSNMGPTHFVGQHLAMNDGAYMVRVLTDAHAGSFSVAGVYNGDQKARFLVLLSDDVLTIRRGAKRVGDRSHGPDLEQLVRVPSALVVHRGGAALRVDGPCLAGKVAIDGTTCWAIGFDSADDDDNSLTIHPETPSAANLVCGPRFDVKSSGDPEERTRDQATDGVRNPIYRASTELDFGMTFEWKGEQPFSGFADLRVVHALGQEHFSQQVAINGTGMIRVAFQPEFSIPGISEVWGRLCDADGQVMWADRFRMLHEPESFAPDTRRPDDFDAFWEATLQELATIPLDATIERVGELRDHPTQEIYHVTFLSWNRQRIHAGLMIPKGAREPLPARLTAHPNMTGYRIGKKDGVYGSTEHERTGNFVSFFPFIRGFAPEAPDIPPHPQWWGDMGSRDDYVARSWYCTMVRAIDYLETRPDIVDMDRLAVAGGSQGGALALVTAGLDKRVDACFSMCPAACQFHEILSSYWSFGPKLGQLPKGQTLEQLKTTLSYYDAVSFCPRITVPTYLGFNVGDTTVHAMGPLAAWRSLTRVPADRKHLFIGYSSMHGGPEAYTQAIDHFIANW